MTSAVSWLEPLAFMRAACGGGVLVVTCIVGSCIGEGWRERAGGCVASRTSVRGGLVELVAGLTCRVCSPVSRSRRALRQLLVH